MQIKGLGHVVFYVTDVAKMVAFYEGILGFKLITQKPGMALFSSGRTHHEMLLIEVGGQAEPKGPIKPGLYHVGFKIGDTDEDLKEAIQTLQENNVPILGASDHTVTHSLYIADPDGNELELYVDVNEGWKTNPELVATPVKPLRL